MIIAVSGTPGCGKSTFSKRLADLVYYKHIELTEFIKEHKLADEFDEFDQSLVVDTIKLNNALKKYINPDTNYIIDGHLAHDLGVVDGCIICTCDIKILNKRLLARGYAPEKVRENLDSEIFQICYTESIENELTTEKIDCSADLTDEEIKTTFEKLLKSLQK